MTEVAIALLMPVLLLFVLVFVIERVLRAITTMLRYIWREAGSW